MKSRRVWTVQIIIFLCLFIYFTQVSPLVPFDADDWSFLGTMRLPVPMWGVFNPSKVLPETIGPIVGSIAAFCVYPITHDYIYSITFVQAVTVSLMIVAMLYTFARFLKRGLKLSKKVALVSEAFFFLSFFLLFKRVNSPSYSGFWATDFDCYFHYIIPGLLNATLVMFLATSSKFTSEWKEKSLQYKGVFLIAVYFALFSSPQLSIILASYSIIQVIMVVFQNYQQQGKRLFSMDFFKEISVYFGIIVVWLISIIFDMHGRRAAGVSAANNGGLLTQLKSTIHSFGALLDNQNKKILLLLLLLVIFTLVISLYRLDRDKEKQRVLAQLLEFLSCLALSFVYLMLAYSKAGAGYAGRIDAMWAVIMYFLVLVSVSFAYLLSKYRVVKVVTPLVLVLATLIVANFDYLPAPANVGGYDAVTARNVDNYIINQITQADRNGKAKVTVKVPLGPGKVTPKDPSSNWPHAYYMAKWLQNTLYSHGIIRNRIEITIKPDKQLNKRFYPNVKNQQPFTPLEIK